MPVMPPSHHPDTFRSPGDARTAWRPSQSAQRPQKPCDSRAWLRGGSAPAAVIRAWRRCGTETQTCCRARAEAGVGLSLTVRLEFLITLSSSMRRTSVEFYLIFVILTGAERICHYIKTVRIPAASSRPQLARSSHRWAASPLGTSRGLSHGDSRSARRNPMEQREVTGSKPVLRTKDVWPIRTNLLVG
jgi:hypothetical protein